MRCPYMKYFTYCHEESFKFNRLSLFPNSDLIESMKKSSHRGCSVKKSVIRNFAKFTGKHLCQSLFLIKFPVNFPKFLRTRFWQNRFFYFKFPWSIIVFVISTNMISFSFNPLQHGVAYLYPLKTSENP